MFSKIFESKHAEMKIVFEILHLTTNKFSDVRKKFLHLAKQ